MNEVGHSIMLVEDEDAHAELVRRIFYKEACADMLEHVRSAEDCLTRLKQQHFDLLILDYSLPDLNGIELMEELHHRHIDTPVIVITGRGDENVAVQVMKLGATDYIVKTPTFTQTLPAIAHNAIESHQLKRRFREAQEHLHFQALLLENVHDAIIGTDTENEIIYWNLSAERIFGWDSEAILGRQLGDIFPLARASTWWTDFRRSLQLGEVNSEWSGLAVSGRELWLSVHSRLITNAHGQQVGLLYVAQNITEQKKLQQQTDRQAQHTAIINQVLNTTAATIDVDDMLPQIVRLIADVFECDCAWIEFPCGINRPSLRRRVEAGSSLATEPLNWVQELGDMLASEFFDYLLCQPEEPLALDDAAFDSPAWREFLQRHRVQSQLLVVLRPRTSLPWLLGLWRTQLREWTEREKELFNEIARVITVALEKALLYKRAQESAAREQLVSRITQAISQSLDIDRILQTICEELGKNLHVDRCYFVKFSESTQAGIITHEYREPDIPSLADRNYTREQFGMDFEQLWFGKPLICGNVPTVLTNSPLVHEGTRYGVKSLLTMPVMNEGTPIGAIGLNQCSYSRDWNEDEIALVEAIARHCTIALHNARLYSQSRKSEERYRSLFNNANDAILIADVENGAIIDANSKAETLLGHEWSVLIGMHLTDLHPKEEEKKYQEIYRGLNRARRAYLRDATVLRKDGTLLPAELNASLIGVGQKAVIQVLVRDMSEQRKLEQQLLHAQRLESIGTLTGGIAHDFNNLLAGILGYSELLKKKLDSSSGKLYNYASIIEQSARHGAELAQRLVAFARGGNLKSQTIDLNAVVEDTLKLLIRALGRSIEVESHLDAKLSPIEANSTLVQQILMNLCINARDAMPEGGKLTVLTKNFLLEEGAVPLGILRPGQFATLIVEDTGTGMDQRTLERIFEPFFTTKEVGKGTGLGLAMVANIVKEAKGHIKVESELGKGTCFRIYLPVSAQNWSEMEQTSSQITGGSETILVVDDEETLRYLAKDLLEAYGYRVLLAADGPEALDIYRRQCDEIALVLLDMVMPRMGGREIYHKLLEINPKAKVVLASGYCPAEEMDQIWTEGIMGFVQKPYQINDLAAELRTVLDNKN
ncbi:MAG: response regulator [Acidobacteriota bacterium]